MLSGQTAVTQMSLLVEARFQTGTPVGATSWVARNTTDTAYRLSCSLSHAPHVSDKTMEIRSDGANHAATGRISNDTCARELMHLFTVGKEVERRRMFHVGEWIHRADLQNTRHLKLCQSIHRFRHKRCRGRHLMTVKKSQRRWNRMMRQDDILI